MNRYATQLLAVLLANAFIITGPAVGADIYKWVAKDGVTQYSEIPPETDLASLETIELPVREAAPAPAQGYQSVLEVANSIEASRLERERLRLEKQKLALQNTWARQADAESRRYEDRYFAAGVYYPRYFYHRPKHPKHRYHRSPRLEHMPKVWSRGDRQSHGGRFGPPARVYINR